ncbi:hypothetical protein NM688_g8955 [Phlebia brevispora]|uniref:Uncharacterized protein n=1 Tax=Phlebia brevispora TaxID=194682 RepID=A0ACC1RL45_9APHY|nr:hypothetical protein NM688_g8955 [Phlebia brevispora]
MERTFGPVLFDMIHRTIPKERYILFDTKKEGRRPDTMKMLKEVYVAFKAEVVLITSNPVGNAELMQGCKENGMHSFGPLWDSRYAFSLPFHRDGSIPIVFNIHPATIYSSIPYSLYS